MTEKLTEASWLLDSRTNLLRMRQEFWLTDGEIAIIDRGIAALDAMIVRAQCLRIKCSSANGINERNPNV